MRHPGGGGAHRAGPDTAGRAVAFVVAFCLAGSALPGVARAQDIEPASGSPGTDAPFDLRYSNEPRISGDGRTIAWVEHFADRQADRWRSRLLLHDTDLRRTRAITSDDAVNRTPRFSPDGRELAWVSGRDGLWKIRVLERGTGRTRTLATVTRPPFELAWSPRGDRIAFMMHVDHPESRIAGLPLPPQDAEWAPPPRVIEEVVSQRDGEEFPDDGTMNLFVVSTSSGQPTRVTRTGFPPGAWSRGSPLSWTPDGSRIVLSAQPDEEPWREPLDTEVVEVLVANGDIRAITSRYGPDDEAVLSPDGRLVAYTGFDDGHQWYQPRNLYVLERQGRGAVRTLSSGVGGDVRRPQWSPDGNSVYALIDQGGLTRLARFDMLGGVRFVAEHIGTGDRASSGSGSFHVARVEDPVRFVVTTTRGDIPGQIALGIGDIGLETIGDEGGPTGDPLGRVESITYESALDGLDIDGWVVLPPGFDADRAYPLIVDVRGGRGSSSGDRFDLEKQALAAAGYLVLDVNYRGSAGYGAEFGNFPHEAPPGDAFPDLLSGADALIGRGWADPERLFIVGEGIGGTIAAWATAHSDRFRAAVLSSPITDWGTYWMTAARSPTLHRYQHEAPPWADPGEYDRRSPMSLVEDIDTPTLIIAADEDYAVPVQQAIAYFRALRLAGVESSLIRVPDAGHGLRDRPSQLVTKLQATLEWIRYFDRKDSP